VEVADLFWRHVLGVSLLLSSGRQVFQLLVKTTFVDEIIVTKTGKMASSDKGSSDANTRR
jgi:ABC-type microcin C transport system permease subunit YejB